jgi:uncharacterized phage-like protein YoqJ
MNKFGMKVEDILVAATKTNSQLLRKEKEIGTLEKGKYADIELEVFITWRGFEQIFSESNRRLYSLIVERATLVHYLSESYYHGVYQERNEAMVRGADYVIAWWNGKPSGTANTVRYAREIGCPVKNIFDSQQLELDI